MDADAVITALADFGRSHRLPPVLWLEDTAGAFGGVDGFGTITTCKSWASVLELQHVPAAGEPMWAGTFGAWNVRIRCDELA